MLKIFNQQSLGIYTPTSALNALSDLGLYYVFPSFVYLMFSSTGASF